MNETYVYSWKSFRKPLYGRPCRILATGGLGSALVYFTDTGQKEIVSRRALRRARADANLDLFGGAA